MKHYPKAEFLRVNVDDDAARKAAEYAKKLKGDFQLDFKELISEIGSNDKWYYTTIHKAIKRLSEEFLEEAMRILAEMTSNSPITAIVDATIFTLSCYEERMVKLKKCKARVTVKLSALWDVDKHIFHSAKVIKGVSRVTFNIGMVIFFLQAQKIEKFKYSETED